MLEELEKSVLVRLFEMEVSLLVLSVVLVRSVEPVEEAILSV